MATFCTISTSSHLFKTFALADSLMEHGGRLHVLVIDNKGSENSQNIPSNVELVDLEVITDTTGNDIVSKYSSNPDKLRWSLKPIWLKHLLNQHDKVIYLDNDIFCFNDFSFLFKELDNSDLLLTPHYYPINPSKNQNWFEANFKVGLYNAGFVAANKSAKEALSWWAWACLYRCEKSLLRGLFDDQKYLDLMPIIYPSTKVLRHRGCNVAEWNIELCKRVKVGDDVLINGEDAIVFYHFNSYSLEQLNNDKSNLLYPYLEMYLKAIQKYNPDFDEHENNTHLTPFDNLKLGVWKVLNKLNK